MTTISPGTMSDSELLDATEQAAREERHATAHLLALLAEFDARRLYLGEGCSSLFSYCTRVLHISEHAAYHRIEAARAARQFPILLDLVAAGDVTLTTVALLRPHLTPHNHAALLSATRHKSKREVEHQIASLVPKPDVTAMIRRVPEPKAASSVGTLPLSVPPATAVLTTPVPRAKVAPLASDRYLLRVTLSADAHTKLRRAQDLMRHTIPDGDVTKIVTRALTLLVNHLERTTNAKTSRPRTRSKAPGTRNRHIPAQVQREVWARDGGRCAFIGSHGRCIETGALEFHHLIPFARGGATDVANISLRCRAHNGFESEKVFGPWQPPNSPHATRSGPS